MVHALREAHRVLRSGGVVADLRPERDPGHLRARRILAEFQGRHRTTLVGIMRESTEYIADYIASDKAVARALRQELFILKHSETFWLRTFFRSMEAVERYLATEWTGTTIPARTYQALQRLAARDPGGWIVASDLFRLNVLGRLDSAITSFRSSVSSAR